MLTALYFIGSAFAWLTLFAAVGINIVALFGTLQ